MYSLSKKYGGKRAFITGAASGFGRALAYELAKDGWTIAVVDIDEMRAGETAGTIESLGGKGIAYHLDVADKEQYALIAKTFVAEAGGIDLLINNAGVAGGALFEHIPLEDWEWMVGINLMGVVYGCHHLIPTMKEQGYGHIINVASAAAFASPPRMAPYNATKAAVVAMSETLRAELKGFDIGVSVVMPTFFKTNIVRSSRTNDEEREMGEYVIETSNLSAKEVAQEVLKKAGKNKLYIVLPSTSRWLYLLKRLVPSFLISLNIRILKNRDKVKARLKRKYEQMKERETIEMEDHL